MSEAAEGTHPATGASAITDVVEGHEVAVTPREVPRHGAPENPSAAVLRARFGAAIQRVEVIWGETVVFLSGAVLHSVIRFLHDVEGYDYLVDVTAVEYRESERPLEVVWHLRALQRRRFLRLKVELPKGAPLQVPSIVDIYQGADWFERECYDMFGIRFDGHPDLRRLLLWESYREGHPLRKDFPLRGRFSRSEQLKQALAADPEARYSMEELSIADAFHDLPDEMKQRLAARAARGDAEAGE